MTQRPLRLTSSESSVVSKRWVAPPGRSDPRSKGRRPLIFVVCRPKPDQRWLNLFLRVDAEKGHSKLVGGAFAYTAVKSFTISGGSMRAAWCRAARPLVLGVFILNNPKVTPGAESHGSMRSQRCAIRTSPILQIPHQVKLKTAASSGQPHMKANASIANKMDSGSAGWCSLGSSVSQAKAGSQAPASCFLTTGRAADTANFPYAFPDRYIS